MRVKDLSWIIKGDIILLEENNRTILYENDVPNTHKELANYIIVDIIATKNHDVQIFLKKPEMYKVMDDAECLERLIDNLDIARIDKEELELCIGQLITAIEDAEKWRKK